MHGKPAHIYTTTQRLRSDSGTQLQGEAEEARTSSGRRIDVFFFFLSLHITPLITVLGSPHPFHPKRTVLVRRQGQCCV